MPPLAVSLVLFSTLLHASWNLLAKRGSSAPALFPRVLMAVAVPGVLIGVLGEWRGASLLATAWPFLLVAGMFQASYFLGLTMGYRTGDLSLVYPLVRALPVLLVSGFDVLRGQVPGAAGWLGLALVLGGCLLVARPAGARRADRPPEQRPRWHGTAIGWAALAALGTVGYTVADKLAADAITAAGQAGGVTAFRYGLWEFTITAAYYLSSLALWDRLRRRPASRAATGPAARSPFAAEPGRWPVTVLIATLMLVTYALVLWAYQMSWQTSYVVALRQFSIVAGVVGGALLLGEAARTARIAGAVVIVAGVAAITFAGGT
jgi:drug/metabolite transporter (DMT)-like permease